MQVPGMVARKIVSGLRRRIARDFGNDKLFQYQRLGDVL